MSTARWPRRRGIRGRTGRSSAGQSRSARAGLTQRPAWRASRAADSGSKNCEAKSTGPDGNAGKSNSGSTEPGRRQLRQGLVRPGLDPLPTVDSRDRAFSLDRQEHDLTEAGVLRVGEAVAGEPLVVARQVAGGHGQPPLRHDEDEQAAGAEGAGRFRQEGVLQPLRLVVVVVGRVEPEAGEGAVGQPDGEGAGAQGVVEDGLRLIVAVAGDLDAIGLAADDIDELAQGRAGAAAGVEQAHDLSRRGASGPDEGGDPLDD